MTVNQKKIAEIIDRIKALEPGISRSVGEFRSKISAFEASHSEDVSLFPGSYWKHVAYVDALVKLRIFIEQNFSVIETLGVLSLTRYIFELAVWIRLMKSDDRYGLLYYRILLKEMQEYYEKLARQCEREVALLERLEAKERNHSAKVRQAARNVAETNDALWKASNDIDEEAAELFSIYADDAKRNGYGFQAHLIEKQALPNSRDAAAEAARCLQLFDSGNKTDISYLRKEKWRWDAMATKAGMSDEYEFIYSYTSRLLHAKPSSLTTDQKSLEETEMYIFLRYCFVKMLEIGRTTQSCLNAENLNLH